MSAIVFRGCVYVEAKRNLVPAVNVETGMKVMVSPHTLQTQPQRYKVRRTDPAERTVVHPAIARQPAPTTPTAPDTAGPQPHELLLQAMAAKRVPYTPNKQETSALLAPTQLPPAAQSEVRQRLRDTLGYLGLHHHGVKRGANSYLLNDDPDAYGSYNLATGAINMQERVHQRAMAFLRDPHNPRNRKYADDAATLLHETIHSCSPLHHKAYATHAAFVEEATTELLSRKVMRDKFGVPDEHWQEPDGSVDGSYGKEIHGLLRIISRALGDPPTAHRRLQQMVEDAAVKMRQPQPKVFDRRNPYVDHFVAQLELPEHLFAGMNPEMREQKEREVRNNISNAISEQYGTWEG
jgi:hypothetical protein